MDIIRIFVPEACEQEASPVGCGWPVPIGYVGENGVRQVVLDFSPWVETYGPGALTLMFRRNGDTDAYPVALEIDGSTAAWTVSNVDTHTYGVGRAQYMYVVDGENVKSAIFQTFVDKSVTQPGSDPPDPYEGWVQHLTELGAETLVNAQAAAESASDSATAKTAAEAAQTAAEDAQEAAEGSERAAAGSASDSDTSALKSEGFAVGKQNGTDVGSGSPYYQNNAKHYSQLAGLASGSASNSALAAAGRASDAAGSAEAALAAKTAAETAQAAAAGSAADAAAAKTAAEAAQEAAEGSERAAAGSATDAAGSAEAALDAKNAAETAQGLAEDAQEAAEQAQSDAETAAQSVSQSAAQISQNASDIGVLKNTMDEITVDVDNPVEYTSVSNYVMNSSGGAPATNVGNAFKLSSFIPVQAGEVYYLTASMNYGNYFYRFYRTETEPSFSAAGYGGYKAQTGGTFTNIANREITIPDDATFMRIGYNTGSGRVYSLVKRTSIATIANEITDQLEDYLDSKYEQIKKWVGKTWVAIGDSLTEANNTASTKYHNIIANKTGITVLNYGKSGTGYGKTYDTFDNFCDRVLTLGDVDCDIITIFGSFNDLSLDLGTADDTGTSTLGGYMNTTFDNLYSTKPFVSVGIILPTPWQGKTPAGTSADAVKAQQYCEMLKTIAQRRSIPVLDLYHDSNLHPAYRTFRDEFYSNADGVHPNNLGHAKIAPAILNFLESIIEL